MCGSRRPAAEDTKEDQEKQSIKVYRTELISVPRYKESIVKLKPKPKDRRKEEKITQVNEKLVLITPSKRSYLFFPILIFVVAARNRDWLSRSDRPLMGTKDRGNKRNS